MKKWHLLLLLLLLCLPTLAQLQVGKPEDVGMSSERLARIDNMINEHIQQKWVPGAVALIIRKGKIVHYKAYGVNNTETNSVMKKDDIFRIASQTKAITSLAIMMLFEEGKILLNDPVSKFIPEFKNPQVLKTFSEKDTTYTTEPAKSEVTIRHLLSHISGIDYAMIGSREMRMIYAKAKIPSGIGTPDNRLGDKIKALARLPLKHHPGENYTYSLSTDVLGYVVEVVSGMTLADFFQKRIFEPLEMKDTYFYLPKEKHGRLVSLYEEKNGVAIKRKAEGEGMNPDYPNVSGTYFSGGAGLSSTIEDYAHFLQMLLDGGTYAGKRMLSRKTIELMLTNQTGELPVQFGLGFGLETAKNDAQSIVSLGSFNWGGIFATTYWVDPKEKLVGLVYTQIFPTTHSIADRFKVLTYQAIVD